MIATLAVLLPPNGFGQAPPATSPATAPSSNRRDTIAKLFAQLADDRDSVREAARASFMQMNPEDLPILREIVAKSVSLQPSQIVPLRTIVIHVFLRGQTYEKTNVGFLGVLFGDMPDDGVRVEACWPGSCGNTVLEEGDIVVAVDRPHEVAARRARESGDDDQWTHVDVHVHQQMILLMEKTLPGDEITLTLERRGRTLHVPIKVDARPQSANLEMLGEERRQAGEDYWNDNFAPLLDKGVS